MEKKYGIWAVRGSGSIFGAAQSWCKDNGIPIEYDTKAEARKYAKELHIGIRTVNVQYFVKEKDPEPVLYIRSAAHSNYTGMVAMIRTDEKVYLGKKENYVFGSGKMEKQSVVDRLKAEHTENKEKQITPFPLHEELS